MWCEVRVERGAQATCETEAEGGAQASSEVEADGDAQALLEVQAKGGAQARLEAEGRDGKGTEPWFAEMARKRSDPGMKERPAGDAGWLEAKRKPSGRF